MYEYVARVVSVYDGDTFRADVDLGFGVWITDQAFRLYGVQAWELGSADGKPARDFVRRLMPVDSEILIKTRKDAREKYGRMLATVLLPQVGDLGDALVAAGHAVSWDGKGPKPEQLSLFPEPDSHFEITRGKIWRPLRPRPPEGFDPE